jgi:hypothetical protein
LLTFFIQHMGYNISLVRGGLQVKTMGPWPIKSDGTLRFG